MHGLDAFLAWIDENETAYRKLMQSVASVPEARELSSACATRPPISSWPG